MGKIMKVSYDKKADAAYLYVKGRILKGEVKKSIPSGKNIVLDFDDKDKLIGIEVLNASKIMPKGIIPTKALA